MRTKKESGIVAALAIAVFSLPVFCQAPAGTAPALHVGANIHWATGSGPVAMLTQANVAWVRTGTGWDVTEPTLTEPPTYDWTIADGIVASNKSLGLQMLWGFGGTPAWASSNGEVSGTLKDEIAEAHFRNFVKATAERYPEIIYYEFWNEPNLSRFWVGATTNGLNRFSFRQRKRSGGQIPRQRSGDSLSRRSVHPRIFNWKISTPRP